MMLSLEPSFAERLKLAAIAMVILFAVLTVSASIPPSFEELGNLSKEAETLFEKEWGVLDVWANNELITLLTYIPFIGLGVGGFIVFHTGRLFAWLGAEIGIHPVLLIMFAIITVYGLVEFMAYGFAFSQSMILSYTILTRGDVKTELKWTLISIGIATILLLVAAWIEVSLIEFSEEFLGTILLGG